MLSHTTVRSFPARSSKELPERRQCVRARVAAVYRSLLFFQKQVSQNCLRPAPPLTLTTEQNVSPGPAWFHFRFDPSSAGQRPARSESSDRARSDIAWLWVSLAWPWRARKYGEVRRLGHSLLGIRIPGLLPSRRIFGDSRPA